MTALAKLPTVDELAQEIRRVDGNHSLGAGALAEALMPFLAALSPAELGGVEADFDKWYGSCDARLWNNWDACKAAYIAGQKSTPRAAEAVTEYRWRSVSDDLPERTGWYIGINYGVVEPLRWDGNNWHHTRVTRDLAMPSHWRPLPAPPSAKGEL